MWSFIQDGPSFVQFVLLVSCPLLGLSHIVRPQMWIDYLNGLHAQGASGVITRTFTMELWPALLMVSLHQVWHGPAIVITVYGWLMLAKIAISLLFPEIGLRSLAMASRGPRGFVLAGLVLIAIGVIAGLALFWRQ
jgi:hypothetical protein